MTTVAELSLSAQRAFLGRIHPEMRLIKIGLVGNEIIVSIILDRGPTERVSEDISEATSEIIADFPGANKIREDISILDVPLMVEDVLANGWIYRRAE